MSSAGPNAVHVISTAEPVFGWALLHGLVVLEARVLLLGPLRDVERARAIVPNLRFLGAASAPRRWIRSMGRSLGREAKRAAVRPSTVCCWDDASFRAANAAFGHGVAVHRVPSALAFVPPTTGVLENHCKGEEEPDGHREIVAIGCGEAVDAFACMQLAGVLAYAGEAVTLTLPQDAVGLRRAQRFLGQHGGAWELRVVDPLEPPHCHRAACALIMPHGDRLDPAHVARLKSDAALAKQCDVPVIAKGSHAEAIAESVTQKLPGDASLPTIVRAIREATSSAESAEPTSDARSFSDWASDLRAWIDEPERLFRAADAR